MQPQKISPSDAQEVGPLKSTEKVVRSLYLGLLVVLFLLLAFFAAQYAINGFQRKASVLLKLDKDLSDLLSLLQDAETGQRGFLLTEKEYYLEPYLLAKAHTEPLLLSIENYGESDLVAKDKVLTLKSLANRKFAEIDRTISLVRDRNSTKALAIVDTDLGKDLMDEIRAEIGGLRKKASLAHDLQEDRIKTINVLMLLVETIAVAALLFVFYSIYSSLQPLLDRIRASYQELKTNRSSLEQKNKELEHFAYIASHDLNEPLRTITSFVDLLVEEKGVVMDDETRQYFSFIHKATERMRGMITGLLSYSRIGKSADFAKHDLQLIVQHLREDLSVLIQEKQAEIKVEKLPILVCLRIEVRQLFQNLLVNAMKFSKPGKTPIITITAEEENDHWRFGVKDNGIGIAPEQQHKIFSMFSRLHHRNQFEGQGIGLAFCRKIVDAHGGKIWVTSEVGQGSTFYFTLSKHLTNEKQLAENPTH